MKRVLLFVAVLLPALHLFAQNTIEVRDTGTITRERWRDSLFRIDKSQVPSGVLLEYSLMGFRPTRQDGLNNDDDTLKQSGRVFELHNILTYSKVNPGLEEGTNQELKYNPGRVVCLH